MKAEHPNLPLIEEKFVSKLEKTYRKDCRKYDFQIVCFRQGWPNTAGGFQQPGIMSGQMLINEYTTVIFNEELNVYGVAFGNRIGYVVKNPNDAFKKDLQNLNMANVGDAKTRYYTNSEKNPSVSALKVQQTEEKPECRGCENLRDFAGNYVECVKTHTFVDYYYWGSGAPENCPKKEN